MLRVLYGLILRAHPEYFRQRFGEQMQSIFDEAENGLAEAALLADAIASLLRQWSLRPQFWEERPLAVAGQGAPLFSSLDSSKPRTAALVYGAVLSALVLNGVSWTMGYAWNHPIFIEWHQPVIVPPASWNTKSSGVHRPEATETGVPELSTSEGRVVLIFTSHAHAAATPVDRSSTAAFAQPSGPANAAGPSSKLSATPPAGLLQSYAGTYIGNSTGHERVNVTFMGGGLQLDVVGLFRSPLTPLSNAPVLACGGNCWVRFWSNASGTVDQIEIHSMGREIQAFRVQGAVF